MEMFGNAAAAASLVHAGLSAGGLSDHLAGLEACASLSNPGFGLNTSSTNLSDASNPLVGLATSSALASGRAYNSSNGSMSNPSTSSHSSHYHNSSPYSAHHNQTLNNFHPYQQTTSPYHNNYTSSSTGVSSLGYQDSLSTSFPGLTYPATNPNSSSVQQRLFSNSSATAAPLASANIAADSILTEENGLTSALLSSSSSRSDKGSDFQSKIRKESNYSPSNISSSFLPSSTVKIKTGINIYINYNLYYVIVIKYIHLLFLHLDFKVFILKL